GTLDDTSWLRPTAHIWTRSKQPWLPIPEGDRKFETQPPGDPWWSSFIPAGWLANCGLPKAPCCARRGSARLSAGGRDTETADYWAAAASTRRFPGHRARR